MKSTFTRAALVSGGFQGFVTVADLRSDRCATVPHDPGVYVVLLPSAVAKVSFLRKSTGGWFKGKDPTVDAAVLRSKWVDGATVVYLGKSDDLHRRIRQFIDFGAGRPVGHWGGRLVWQIARSEDLLLAWNADQAPLARESTLIAEFVAEFGAMPYASLRR